MFGVELDPHPDFTAMAVLALHGSVHSGRRIISRSLDYLVTRLIESPSPYSLAWALMALHAYGHPGADQLRRRLEAYTGSSLESLPGRVLALVALALEQPAFTFEGTTR